MQHIDTLIRARWIIPIEPAELILERHAIAIHQGRIIEIGPASRLAERFSPTELLDRPNHVLLPGFINADAEVSRALLPASNAHALESRWVDAEFIRDSVELSITRMMLAGITCFSDATLFPEIAAETASLSAIRACIGLPVRAQANAWAESADEAISKGLQLHDEYRSDPLVTTHFAPSADLSDETLLRVRRAVDELELPVTFRFAEIGSTETCVDRLDRVGLLSALLIAVNPHDLARTDLERLAHVGANIVCCSGLENAIHDFRTHGLNVGAGAGTRFKQDVLEMTRGPRCSTQSSAVSPGEWLKIITLNGAHALGLDEQIGSLVAGKWADIACVDVSDVYAQPIFDIASHVTDYANRNQVTDVWVAGRHLVRDRRPVRIDVTELLNRVERWRARIAGSSDL
jgi:5-methylthioadenosine/S-adenosylhomocysteine deaminase